MLWWAAVTLLKPLQDELLLDDDWHEAIISIIRNSSSKVNVVQKEVVRVYITEDFEEAKFYDAKISVITMGYIRATYLSDPSKQPGLEAYRADLYKDIATATISLARPAWRADETLGRIRFAASSTSFTRKYMDLRQNTRKQIDRVSTRRLE